MTTLRGVSRGYYCVSYMVDGGVSLEGRAMLKIGSSCFNSEVCLSPIFFSGIIVVGLRIL